MGPFQHHDNIVFDSYMSGTFQPVGIAGLRAEHALQLNDMRGEYGAGGQRLQNARVLSNAVQRVGIEHEGLLYLLKQMLESRYRGGVAPHARACGQRRVTPVRGNLFDMLFAFVGREERFGYSCLQNEVGAARRVDRYQTGPAVQGSPGGENRSSHHAVLSGGKQQVAVVVLVGVFGPSMQVADYIDGRSEVVVGGRLGDSPGVQTDVEHLDPTGKLGILGKEEGQFRSLEGKGEVGFDHTVGRGVGIPFAEEARGDVDGDDKGLGLVDISGQRGKSARKRVVQSGPEQAVDDGIASLYFGRSKLVGDFVELGDAGSPQSVAVARAVGRQAMAGHGIEQIDGRLIAQSQQQASRSQCIAPVVAGAGKDIEAAVGRYGFTDLFGESFCCPLHQVDRVDRLVF